MHRIQAQLTEEQIAGLKRLAHERSTSVAQLLRQGADRVLQDAEVSPGTKVRQKALSVLGAFSGGGGSAARDHDQALAEIYGGRVE